LFKRFLSYEFGLLDTSAVFSLGNASPAFDDLEDNACGGHFDRCTSSKPLLRVLAEPQDDN
jgi:hypothetical protein